MSLCRTASMTASPWAPSSISTIAIPSGFKRPTTRLLQFRGTQRLASATREAGNCDLFRPTDDLRILPDSKFGYSLVHGTPSAGKPPCALCDGRHFIVCAIPVSMLLLGRIRGGVRLDFRFLASASIPPL